MGLFTFNYFRSTRDDKLFRHSPNLDFFKKDCEKTEIGGGASNYVTPGIFIGFYIYLIIERYATILLPTFF